MTTLSGKTILMSGGSRGIGLAIALRAAADGANIALIAKTDKPDPRLQGTIHTAAEAIEAAGGHALPIVGDVRDDETIERAVEQAAERFLGIDIVVNNASVLNLSGTTALDPKRYDLMQDVNVRGTFMLTRAAMRCPSSEMCATTRRSSGRSSRLRSASSASTSSSTTPAS